MNRLPLAVLILAAVAVVACVTLLRHADAGLCYVAVEGYQWDERNQRLNSLSVWIDDPRLLAQVQPWRDSMRREARDQLLRRLLGQLRLGRYCENSLRQPMESLTLVYDDGRREVERVNICKTPFGDCWRQAKDNYKCSRQPTAEAGVGSPPCLRCGLP